MGRVVCGVSCPWGELSWGELSMGRDVYGTSCLWGEMSQGRVVVGRVWMGQVVLGASCPGTPSHVSKAYLTILLLGKSSLMRGSL
jgi:hypothetical protein